jgi:branched-chain amino acid transport system permease protein
MPVVAAMIIGALACVPIGLFAGYPALRRRGLFLGLTTLALGLVMERFIFLNFYFVGSRATSQVGAPSLFGLGAGRRHGLLLLRARASWLSPSS